MNSNENNLYLLSTKDIEQLTQFLTNALLHFKRYHSTSEEAFLNNLHIVADCYRLTLLHVGKAVAFDERLQIFTQYFESKAPLQPEKVSFAIAEMISFVSDQIRLLSIPWFYSAYLYAVSDLLGVKIACLHSNRQVGSLLQSKLIEQGLRRCA